MDKGSVWSLFRLKFFFFSFTANSDKSMQSSRCPVKEVEIAFCVQTCERITLLSLTYCYFPLFQSGLPAMNVEILSQFPSPPVPNLPALAMAMATVMPQHQQPMMNNPPISMAIPTPAPPVLQMAPVAPTQAPTNASFIPSFPPVQVNGFKECGLWF